MPTLFSYFLLFCYPYICYIFSCFFIIGLHHFVVVVVLRGCSKSTNSHLICHGTMSYTAIGCHVRLTTRFLDQCETNSPISQTALWRSPPVLQHFQRLFLFTGEEDVCTCTNNSDPLRHDHHTETFMQHTPYFKYLLSSIAL